MVSGRVGFFFCTPYRLKTRSIQGILRLQTHDSLVGIELKSLGGTFSIGAFLHFQGKSVKSYRVSCRGYRVYCQGYRVSCQIVNYDFFVKIFTTVQIPPPINPRMPNAVTPVSPVFFLHAEHTPVLFLPTMVLPHILHFLSLLLFLLIIYVLQ